ncbi:hypothetical protein TeGR_g15007 [Tetraparma gracilis]|uniref:ABM domain-containing protein n=1 Tax=Tetraparma gracilis TaxID=2962635 RepID=A0ABQ6MP76_9STRA|nr:hypothetical protein TeGR_g15007 [Tetraparma gracilis]
MVSQTAKTAALAVTCLLTGAVLNDLLAKLLTPKKCNKSCLIICHTISFKGAPDLAEFRKLVTPLADAAFQALPGVLSFEVSSASDGSPRCLVFERHVRDGHFQDNHDIFRALGVSDKEKAGVTAYKMEGFVEDDIGHMERW